MEEISDEEEKKQKSDDDIKEIKKAFKEHQIPSFVFFGGTSLLGIGLFFVGPWAILLGFAFLIPSVFAIVNAILCMNPTGIQVYIAKICRNVAWILLGAGLIAFGLVSCAGYLGFAFIGFGGLSVLRGILNAMVGSTTDVINIQRQLVELGARISVGGIEINTTAEREVENGGVYDLKSKNYASKRRKFLSYMIFSVFTSVATGVLVVTLSLPLVVTLILCGMAVINLVVSILRICFLKKQEEHVKHFQNAIEKKKLVWFLVTTIGLMLLLGSVLPFGPFVPAFVGLVKFLGVSPIVLRVFLVAFILCAFVKITSTAGKQYENIKFQLAFREIEYGRCKTKLPRFMKEEFAIPRLRIGGCVIDVQDMNGCFGKVDGL